MSNSESRVQAEVRLAAVRAGCSLFRNNSGAAADQLTGRLIRYGLGNDSAKLNAVFKSSDLIGLSPTGRFLAVECKRSDWNGVPSTDRELAQARFIAHVLAFGGVAGFVRSVEEFHALISG